MEKEKLFFKLFETIKEVQSKEQSFSCREWSKELYCELLKMTDSTLDIVLEIFSRLNYYSYYNISFIINKSDMLERIFYWDGNFINEKLELLSTPYDRLLYYSPIIAEYCYTNKIPIEEVKEYIFLSDYKDALEIIIKKENISNIFIANNLEYLFSIYKNAPKLYSLLKLGPLHEMQITIYEKTRPENANSDRLKYVRFISNHKYDANTLDKVINYINNCKFVEYETVEFICALDIESLDEFIEKYGKKTVLEQILNDKNSHKLCKSHPKLLMNILDSNLNLEQKKKMVNACIRLDSKKIEAIEILISNIN